MKILIIGGHGLVGKGVTKYYKSNGHEVLVASRTTGDVNIDIANSASIEKTLEGISPLDAIVCIAGEAKWAAFDQLSEEDYYIGIRSKLMGQVNLVRIGQKYLKPQGSITLSTGILGDLPVLKTCSAAMVNGALHSFVKAVNLEIGHKLRVNVVSLGLVEDAYEKYKDYFPGHNPIRMEQVVHAYNRAILGADRGEIIRVY